MPTKSKNPQKELLNESQKGDSLYTPNYATDLIAPHIPTKLVWECCAGDGMIADRLVRYWEKDVMRTEINGRFVYHNFLLETMHNIKNMGSIVTNPPFSLKEKFIRRCIEYDIPFALLLPLDYSRWMCDLIPKYNLEKLIPTRRISFITPNILIRVHMGEVWEIVKKDFTVKHYSKIVKRDEENLWGAMLLKYENIAIYDDYHNVPNPLLSKYSQSQFHSGWITRYFGFGKSENFVDLPLDQIQNNIV